MHGADSAYLRYQYADSEKLRIRIQSHELYSERRAAQSDFQGWVISHLGLTPGQTLLDLGSGPGTYHHRLRQYGVQILAIDASLGMLREARQQALDEHIVVWPIQADLQALPFASSVADCAMANHVFFYVPDQARALSEIRRVVKPGGRVVITTNAASNGQRLKELHHWAAGEAGYTPITPVGDRFTLDDLPLMRSVFPDAELDVLPNSFVFPTADAALRYFASGFVDQIAEWQLDRAHHARIIPLVQSRLEEIIAREGVFRDDKTVGCFVATMPAE